MVKSAVFFYHRKEVVKLHERAKTIYIYLNELQFFIYTTLLNQAPAVFLTIGKNCHPSLFSF